MFENIPEELRLLRQWCLKNLQYDPDRGEFFNLYGKSLDRINNGYIRFKANKKDWYGHQLAFLIVYGYIPKEIDHIDKNKLNNKISNLRETDRFKNMQNVLKRKINKSGLKGVSWSKSNNCWRMDIRHNHIRYHSYHKTKEEAYAAYCQKSAELHGEFGSVI